MGDAVKEVNGWSVKRSGGGMTLTGASNGAPVRAPDIKSVRVEGSAVFAYGRDGKLYHLRVGAD